MRIDALRPLAGRLDLDATFDHPAGGQPTGAGRMVLTGLGWGGRAVTDQLSGVVRVSGSGGSLKWNSTTSGRRLRKANHTASSASRCPRYSIDNPSRRRPAERIHMPRSASARGRD